MERALIAAVFCACAGFAGGASAQTLNKCVDANGKTVYTQAPCPAGSKASTVKTDPAPAAAGDAGQPQNLELEFRKRQRAREEQAKKDADQSTKAAEAKENCSRARASMIQLETGRVSFMNDKGERAYLDENQIATEKVRTKALIEQWCKSG